MYGKALVSLSPLALLSWTGLLGWIVALTGLRQCQGCVGSAQLTAGLGVLLSGDDHPYGGWSRADLRPVGLLGVRY
jgi:hypothetical protein